VSKVKRIYPESKTGLINYIEENFHNIDQFVATFSLNDGTTMSVYDSFSYLEAVGLAGIQLDCIHDAAHNETFVRKSRVENIDKGGDIVWLK
jgi:hypothetical protein